MPSVLYIITSSPQSSREGADALEAVMASCAAELDVHILFIHEGVWQLKKAQATPDTDSGFATPPKLTSKMYGAAFDYGVSSMTVYEQCLVARGLVVEDLFVDVAVADRALAAKQIAYCDRVIVF
ncbi:MAG: DsrE family protein [Pseudomonadota bacterium]